MTESNTKTTQEVATRPRTGQTLLLTDQIFQAKNSEHFLVYKLNVLCFILHYLGI